MWILLSLISSEAFAHRPSYGNEFTSAAAAFEVEDPDISIVLYSEMTCEQDQIWMHLDTEDREEIWVQLGIPQLDRLEDYRPSLALVAPGLPEAEVPFDVPEGMGVTVFDTSDVDEPEFFYEEFTSTASWVLYSGWIAVPQDSEAYLVAWDPSQHTGKLWVAVGVIEDFSDSTAADFVYWMEATQSFHEVDGELKDSEESCMPAEPEAAADSESVESSGCSQAAPVSRGGAGLWFLAAVGGRGLRRRGGRSDLCGRRKD